jgi:acetyltransferase-like isoleucine patch superfamily enzyme
MLKRFAGEGFANELFSTRLLVKHFFIQKVFRFNSHVPWPVHPSSKISGVENIVRGNRCPGLSPGCYIQGKNGIIFGKNVWIGPGVGIISANHSLVNYFEHPAGRPIRIGDNCWIGMNAVILPEVELGEHVVVGAGAVVTQNFGPNCLIAGNPARVIRELGPYNS